MFIGFPPSAKRNYYHNEFLPGHFLVIALEAAKKLQWQINNITETGFSASDIGKSGTARAEIEFTIMGENAEIISRSASGFFDFGRNAGNMRKFNEALIDLKYDLKPDDLDRMLNDLRGEFKTGVNQDLSLEPPTEAESVGKSGFGFLSMFIPRKDYLVTPVLININILLFIIQILSGVHIIEPDGESMVTWGGNFRPVTLSGQWWRLLTSCFLHIGVIHLLMNMYALMYIGVLLEPLIGSRRFGYAYLVTGILASVTSVCWHESTISAGASGAIFGMYGVFATLLTTNVVDRNLRKAQLSSIIIFIVYNLMYGMKGGIDNAAHIGGLISGIIIGFTFYPALKNPEFKRSGLMIGGSTLLVLILVSAFFISRTSDPIGEYTRIMDRFGVYEDKALGIYKLDQFASDEKYLAEIENNGLPNWMKCKDLVDSAGRVEDLPENLIEHNAILKRYCDYRIESFRHMKSSLENESPIYQFALDQYNQKIDLILRKLNGENIDVKDLEIQDPVRMIQSKSGVIVVDGRIVDNIDNLYRNEIKEMTVLKGDNAVALYGEQARDGAILITTHAGAKALFYQLNP